MPVTKSTEVNIAPLQRSSSVPSLMPSSDNHFIQIRPLLKRSSSACKYVYAYLSHSPLSVIHYYEFLPLCSIPVCFILFLLPISAMYVSKIFCVCSLACLRYMYIACVMLNCISSL